MTVNNLPAVGYLSNTSRLTSDMQSALETINGAAKEMIGGAGEGATLSITSNTITPVNNAEDIPFNAEWLQ